MYQNIDFENRIFSNKKLIYAIFTPLTLLLLGLYVYKRGLSPFFLLIILTALTLLLTKAFSVLSLFRSIIVEIALLPALTFSVQISAPAITFPEVKWFFQVLITFSFLFRYIIPVFCIMYIVAHEIHEKISLKKYVPYLFIMLIAAAAAIFVPSVYQICYILYIDMIVVVITDICERCLCKDKYNLLSNFPYLFLYLTAIYRLRN